MSIGDGFLQSTSFPPPAPRRRRTEEILATLKRWRRGCAATAVVATAALPLTGPAEAVAVAAAIVLGVGLGLVFQLARESRLRALILHSEFASVPDLARKRSRLVDRRTRYALASSLRQTADFTRSPSRFELAPLLRDRVASARLDLLDAAAALERADDPDPIAVALIRELLRDGASPLYNPNVPEIDLHSTLHRARAGLVA